MVDSPRYMAILHTFCKCLRNGDGLMRFIGPAIRRSGDARLVKELKKPYGEPCWLCRAVTV